MDALRRIVHAIHSANSRAAGELGVTAAQLFVLRQIADAPGLSLSRLSERTRAAQSSVSQVVTRLVAAGLVERRVSQQDGRRTELRLTRAGARLCSQAGETVQERLVHGFEVLTAQEQRSVSEGLEHWIERARLGDIPAGMFLEPDADG